MKSLSILLALAVAAGAIQAQDEAKPSVLQESLKKLESDDAAARDEASKALLALGKDALPQLKESLVKAEKETVKTALAQIIKKLEGESTQLEDEKKPAEKKGNLEKIEHLTEELNQVLSDKSLSEEEKLREVGRIAAQLRIAARNRAPGRMGAGNFGGAGEEAQKRMEEARKRMEDMMKRMFERFEKRDPGK